VSIYALELNNLSRACAMTHSSKRIWCESANAHNINNFHQGEKRLAAHRALAGWLSSLFLVHSYASATCTDCTLRRRRQNHMMTWAHNREREELHSLKHRSLLAFSLCQIFLHLNRLNNLTRFRIKCFLSTFWGPVFSFEMISVAFYLVLLLLKYFKLVISNNYNLKCRPRNLKN